MAKEKDTTGNNVAPAIVEEEKTSTITETKAEKEKVETKSIPAPASVINQNGKGIPTKKVAPKAGTVMGVLRSANAFPTEYTYKKEKAFIPPNGRIPNVKKDLLGFPLPSGVKFIPND